MGVYNGEPKAHTDRTRIQNAHTDRTRIFYRTCEKKQQIECIFLCDSVIAHACQNIIGPTGVRARGNSL